MAGRYFVNYLVRGLSNLCRDNAVTAADAVSRHAE